MKTLSLCVVAAALLCPGVFAADVSAKPIAPLAWLVNGVWSADATQMGNGMQRIETRSLVRQRKLHSLHHSFHNGQS